MNDSSRPSAPGQGRLIFAGSSGFDAYAHLIWIIHTVNDTGYR